MSVPWLVVSPHCDDGVFSCGALLAAHPGSVVVTVFAGTPARYEPFTAWDRACGFEPGDDVMATRRREDAAALACVGAQPVWLSFLDSQYRRTPRVDEVAAALSEAIDSCAPRAIAFPLGLFHSDHVLVRGAMLALASRRELPAAAVYVDALYRRTPGAVEAELAALGRRGHALREREIQGDPAAAAAKRVAVACYASQLRGRPRRERLIPGGVLRFVTIYRRADTPFRYHVDEAFSRARAIMKTRHFHVLALAAAAAVVVAGLATATSAYARGGHGHYHRGGARVGVFIGAPALAYGWYGYRPYYPYPYYYPPAYVPAPVVVQPATPPVYIERSDEQAAAPAVEYWYYCPDSKSYYPYVGTCASPWQRVAPQPQS